MVVVPALQITAGEAFAERLIPVLLVVIAIVLVSLQPLTKPVTEYTVLPEGVTISVDPVFPVLQEYVAAPFTASVAELPVQIVVEGRAVSAKLG
jgi:hypothetical protein